MDEPLDLDLLWVEDEPEDEHTYHRRGAYAPKPLPPNDGNAFMTQGLCAGWAYKHPEEQNLWFSDPGTLEDAKATAMCWECPVRRECLKWASDVQEIGTWGGLNDLIRRRNDHDFNILIQLHNPYENPKTTSRYHTKNLKPHVEKE